MLRFHKVTLCAATLIYSSAALSGYVAIGPITSSSCSNYVVFSSCEFVTVDAVEANGQMYEPRQDWQEVDKYNPSKGSCMVRLGRSGSLALTDKIINAATQPTFYTRKKGRFEKINIEYLDFPCRKTN